MSRSKVIAGIDIGSAKIATVIAQYDPEEDKISVSGVGQASSRGVRKGQIVDIEEAAESIIESVEKAERMAGYSLDHAYVTIGGGHIDSQNSSGVVAVADPSGEINASDVDRVIDAARAVSLPESRQILHVIPKEYKVDGEAQIKDPQGMSGVRLEVETHLITGSSTAVKNVEKSVAESGIDVEGLVFSGLASSYSVLSDTEKELGVILADIGAGTTSIVVYVEGSLVHSTVLPIGGKNVTNDIAAGLRISLDSAEKVKIMLSEPTRKKKKTEEEDEKTDEINLAQFGIEETKKVSEKTLIDGIIKPRLNEIFTMVGMATSQAGVAGKTPSGIVLTGGGSLCVGAAESARRMLSLPARIGFPKGVTGLIDELESPTFASSVGLLIYAVRSGDTEIAWSPTEFISRLKSDFPVKGLISHAKDLFKKILP